MSRINQVPDFTVIFLINKLFSIANFETKYQIHCAVCLVARFVLSVFFYQLLRMCLCQRKRLHFGNKNAPAYWQVFKLREDEETRIILFRGGWGLSGFVEEGRKGGCSYSPLDEAPDFTISSSNSPRRINSNFFHIFHQ